MSFGFMRGRTILPCQLSRYGMEEQPATVRAFYEDGFVAIPSFFNEAELAEIEINLD
ncbi:MAG: hypothetical protein QF749_05065 [Verrucomicrobiota bacterium]|nr:hypothetical protein [Verrucomicrobiota bacterium]